MIDTATGESLMKISTLCGVTKEELDVALYSFGGFSCLPDASTEIGKQLKAFYSKEKWRAKPDVKAQTRNIMIGILTQ